MENHATECSKENEEKQIIGSNLLGDSQQDKIMRENLGETRQKIGSNKSKSEKEEEDEQTIENHDTECSKNKEEKQITGSSLLGDSHQDKIMGANLAETRQNIRSNKSKCAKHEEDEQTWKNNETKRSKENEEKQIIRRNLLGDSQQDKKVGEYLDETAKFDQVNQETDHSIRVSDFAGETKKQNDDINVNIGRTQTPDRNVNTGQTLMPNRDVNTGITQMPDRDFNTGTTQMLDRDVYTGTKQMPENDVNTGQMQMPDRDVNTGRTDYIRPAARSNSDLSPFGRKPAIDVHPCFRLGNVQYLLDWFVHKPDDPQNDNLYEYYSSASSPPDHLDDFNSDIEQIHVNFNPHVFENNAYHPNTINPLPPHHNNPAPPHHPNTINPLPPHHNNPAPSPPDYLEY